MLALISFTLLGIWTTILGIINNSDRLETLLPKSDIVSQSQDHVDQQPKTVYAEEKTPIAGAGTVEAFKNLWNEIIYGG